MHGGQVVYATRGRGRKDGVRGLWRETIVCVPDVRGFRFAEFEHVDAECENVGYAHSVCEHGKPRCVMSTFRAGAKFFAVSGITHPHYGGYGASDRGAIASNRIEIHQKATELQTHKVAGSYAAGLLSA